MKILFALAHPDDESYGPAGTIAKLAKSGHQVWVLSMCKGDRPGAEEVSPARQTAFMLNCQRLNAMPILLQNSDVHLDYHVAVKEISRMVTSIKPDIVYTHSTADIHPDHRVTAEATMIACRPKPESTVQKLYMCELPAATEWAFGKMGHTFNPNVFVDISDFISIKTQCIQQYSSEIYEYPDARSIQSAETMAMNRGKQIGVKYAEAFELVYERS